MLAINRNALYIYPIGLVGCFLAGLVNGVGSLFYYAALSRLDASVGHMLYSFYPVFVALWLLLDHHPLRASTLVRLLVSVPAIYLLVRTGSKPVDLIGAAMMIGSAILYALHLIINQRVLYDVPAPTVTFYTLLSMSAVVVPVYLLMDRSLPVIPAGGSFVAIWWAPVGMALVTFASRLTLFMGVKHLGGLQTALLGLAELLVTVALAQWWLGESLTTGQWIGAGLMIVCLVSVGFDRPVALNRGHSGALAFLNSQSLK
jgi:drug/metabolite transporter (DMT)-like permease